MRFTAKRRKQVHKFIDSLLKRKRNRAYRSIPYRLAKSYRSIPYRLAKS